MATHPVTQPLFILAALLGITWIALSGLVDSYPLSFLLKASPLTLLALLAFLNTRESIRVMLVIAFLSSAAGDALLGIDRQAMFKPALLSFLVTQTLYAWLFWTQRATLNGYRIIGIILAVTLLVVMLVLVLPAVPSNLELPIIVYALTLTIMASGAVVSRIDRLLPYGGLLFMTSDSLIAINQFVYDFPYSTQIIVSIYTLAQLMIGWSLVVREPVISHIPETA